MSDQTEKAALHRAVDALAHAVDAMARRYGTSRPVKRLIGDVERLRLDAADCDDLAPAAGTAGAASQIEVVSDAPYDESLWEGADDEGVGGVRTPGKAGGVRAPGKR